MPKVRFNRSSGGNATSKDGRFEIRCEDSDPKYTVTDRRTGLYKRARSQADCKAWAQQHEADEWPKVYETYSPEVRLDQLYIQPQPSAFNGAVRFRRYRVTVELIEETQVQLHARLQKLWEECDNHHMVPPLRAEAKKLGIELKGDYGRKKKRR